MVGTTSCRGCSLAPVHGPVRTCASLLCVVVLAGLLSSCSKRTLRHTTTSPDGAYVVEFIFVSRGATVMPVTSIVVRRSLEATRLHRFRMGSAAAMAGDPTRTMKVQWIDDRQLRIEVGSCDTFGILDEQSPVVVECAIVGDADAVDVQ